MSLPEIECAGSFATFFSRENIVISYTTQVFWCASVVIMAVNEKTKVKYITGKQKRGFSPAFVCPS